MAAQMSVFPDISTAIIDKRGGRLPLGHADGIQARSVETFQAFGFAPEITAEAYMIVETAFWQPDPANLDHIKRMHRTEDDPYRIAEFPDIRLKSIIQSNHGSILHIPREGGYLFRTYVDLGIVNENDNHAVRTTPLEEIIRRMNEIVAPYSVDVKNVAWWSVYEVGHRVTDRFDEIPTEEVGTRDPHVFISGDACHTHEADSRWRIYEFADKERAALSGTKVAEWAKWMDESQARRDRRVLLEDLHRTEPIL